MARSQDDYQLELTGLKGQRGRLAEAAARAARREQAESERRPWLAVHWRCCEVYNRVYRSPDGQRYEGRCPKCARPLSVKIGPAGTHCRFFEAH